MYRSVDDGIIHAMRNGEESLVPIAIQAGLATEYLSIHSFKEANDGPGKEPPYEENWTFAWQTHQLKQVSDISSWFIPSVGLTYKLFATDPKGVVPEDFKLPLNSFYLMLPPGMFEAYSEYYEGWLPLRFLLVSKGEYRGHPDYPAEVNAERAGYEGPSVFYSLWCAKKHGGGGPVPYGWLQHHSTGHPQWKNRARHPHHRQ